MDKPASNNCDTTRDNSTGNDCNCNTTTLQKILVISPSWISVNQDLRWFYSLHTYGFACLFFVLGFYTLFTILNLRSLISSRPFMSTINIFLCILGVSRSGSLFIDPYNLQETMPKVIASIMWDIGFPCVTSAFCLIQLAFLQLTQLKFGPEKLQKESCLNFIIGCHFFFTIVSDVALALYNHFITKYIVQTIFLGWSIILYLIFLHAGYSVMNLLRTLPNNLLTRENSLGNQKGIMQLAMLAPYNNLATSVAAALVPTLLNSKIISDNDNNETIVTINDDDTDDNQKDRRCNNKQIIKPSRNLIKNINDDQSSSTVPEVYVRPPTPTPSVANLPTITVSSPSRRSSVSNSRRGSDVSKGSRRTSDCSVKFINDNSPTTPTKTTTTTLPDNNFSHIVDRPKTPDSITRRHSDMPTPTGSKTDIRRCSDFTHEKNRSSQFAVKLRRNSDFGNRTPKRLNCDESGKLPQVLDVSPAGSRRNSDLGGLSAVKTPTESRRNSDISYRRNSELSQIRHINTSRRSSEISIKTPDKITTTTTSFQTSIINMEIQERSESDSEQGDCNEKVSLMNDNEKNNKIDNDNKNRKKSLTWKNIDVCKNNDDDITVASSLLGDRTNLDNRVVGNDFTLHAILNHIAYVNRAKSDVPLYIPETNIGAARKNQIKKVLNVTYATAILGIILCIADIIRIFGPYGLLGETIRQGTKPQPDVYPKPWPWLIYQTVCRGLELIMGCAMASITKQPSVSPRHQYFSNYRSYSDRIKHGGNPYL